MIHADQQATSISISRVGTIAQTGVTLSEHARISREARLLFSKTLLFRAAIEYDLPSISRQAHLDQPRTGRTSRRGTRRGDNRRETRFASRISRGATRDRHFPPSSGASRDPASQRDLFGGDLRNDFASLPRDENRPSTCSQNVGTCRTSPRWIATCISSHYCARLPTKRRRNHAERDAIIRYVSGRRLYGVFA